MSKRKKTFNLMIAGVLMSAFVLVGCDKKVEEVAESMEASSFEAQVDNAMEHRNGGEKVSSEEIDEMMKAPNKNASKRGSSEERMKSCDGKSEGDSCEVSMSNKGNEVQSKEGVCKISSKDESLLVCMPDGMKRGQGNFGGGMK